MKRTAKRCTSAFAFCLLAAMVCFASTDGLIGTWKLNEAKSKFSGGPKNDTVTYEAAGDSIKVTVEGTAPDGTKTKSEWTGKMDGKEYPSTGNPAEDARSYKQVNDHTVEFTSTKGGKVVLSGRVVLSADGKTRTVTTTGTGADGKKFKSVAVYDKQ